MEPRQSWTKWAFASPVIRMQVSITLILTTMVTVMAVLIWRETTESQYRQVETYSRMVRDNLLNRTKDNVFAILQSTRNRNELISRNFGLEVFPTLNDKDEDFYKRAKRLLWPSFKMSPQMGSTYFVRDVDGVLVGFSLVQNQTLFYYSANPGNITIKGRVLDNNNGEELNIAPLFYDFMDPRDYFGAEFLTLPDLRTRVRLGNSDDFVVLEVSTRATSQTPLFNSQGDIVATLGIKGTVESAYPLEELSSLMSELNLLGGVMFATSESGIIVAASDDTLPFQINTVTKVKELIRAAQVNNSLVAGTAQWLETKYGNMSNLITSPAKDSNVKIGHKKYFIDTAAVPFPSFQMARTGLSPYGCHLTTLVTSVSVLSSSFSSSSSIRKS